MHNQAAFEYKSDVYKVKMGFVTVNKEAGACVQTAEADFLTIA